MRRLLGTIGMALAAALLLLPTPAGAAGEQAGGTLVDASGKTVGTVRLTQTATGVAVAVAVTGGGALAPGAHGIHFHAVGRCDGPDFASAGGHFNPLNRQHGSANPNGPHAGDLPNFVVGPGTASQGGYAFTTTTSMIALTPGTTSILDADGTALVIHAGADDEKTDPTGNSGGRVACAILTLAAPVAAATQAPAAPRTGGGGEAGKYLIRRLGDG